MPDSVTAAIRTYRCARCSHTWTAETVVSADPGITHTAIKDICRLGCPNCHKQRYIYQVVGPSQPPGDMLPL